MAMNPFISTGSEGHTHDSAAGFPPQDPTQEDDKWTKRGNPMRSTAVELLISNLESFTMCISSYVNEHKTIFKECSLSGSRGSLRSNPPSTAIQSQVVESDLLWPWRPFRPMESVYSLI